MRTTHHSAALSVGIVVFDNQGMREFPIHISIGDLVITLHLHESELLRFVRLLMVGDGPGQVNNCFRCSMRSRILQKPKGRNVPLIITPELVNAKEWSE